jgi:hypothetical protein
MWVREVSQLTLTSMSEQLVRCLMVEEGGMSTLPLTFILTVLSHCNHG